MAAAGMVDVVLFSFLFVRNEPEEGWNGFIIGGRHCILVSIIRVDNNESVL
jgi:hypothetical protein